MTAKTGFPGLSPATVPRDEINGTLTSACTLCNLATTTSIKKRSSYDLKASLHIHREGLFGWGIRCDVGLYHLVGLRAFYCLPGARVSVGSKI